MQRFAVIQPLPEVLASRGFEHAGDLPVIMGEGGTKFDPDANEFLYERCLGYWPPVVGGQQPPVTPRSQRTYAHALADFLSYAATRNLDLTTIDYVRHVYGKRSINHALALCGLRKAGLAQPAVRSMRQGSSAT